MTIARRVLRMLVGLSMITMLAVLAQAQNSAPPVTFTAEQDHQNMMDQLAIKALRPGPSGDEKAPNHANYDESKANPYPNVPDALTLNNGTFNFLGNNLSASSETLGALTLASGNSTISSTNGAARRVPLPRQNVADRLLAATALVLDLTLPGLSGLELQERIASDRRDMPIIFISGYGDVPKTVRAMKGGAVEFLTKPFSDKELLGAIRQAIQRSQSTILQHSEMRQLRQRLADVLRAPLGGVVQQRLEQHLRRILDGVAAPRGHFPDLKVAAAFGSEID